MKRKIQELVRPNILNLEPYSTARDEYAGGEIEVWLDANENPFDSGINRYPDPHQKALKERLSQIKQVPAHSIFLGNGSDEPIDVVYRVFCRPGIDNAISIAPTYGMYKVAAATNDVELREVQLRNDFSMPVEDVLRAADQNSKLLWICSPNNPTANSFPASQIEELVKRFDGIVVLDEAYIDFADQRGFLPRLDEFENLVILQTLSKAWGMAALRLGLAFAAPRIIELMNRVKYPYNINSLTQERVMNELDKGVDNVVECIKAERKIVERELSAMPVVERLFPSQANFVLIRTAAANRLYDTLIENGVIVRNRSKVRGCENTLRITIGTPDQNRRMLQIIKDFKV